MTSGTPIPRSRRILYSLLVTLAGLLLIEGAARVAEPRLFPYKRSIPLPAPGAPGSRQFIDTTRKARQQAGLPERQPLPMTADPRRGWAFTPNANINAGAVSFRTNSLGMRGAEPGPLEPGEVRLLTLGDSTIFGDGVAEEAIFSSVAATELSSRWGRKVTVVVGAVPGHDSSQSRETLKLYGARIQPTWVVMGNLWSDVYRRDGKHNIANDLAYAPPVRQRLRGYATYRILWQLLNPWLDTQRVKWMASREDVADPAAGRQARVPLEEYVDNLRTMVAQAKALGARPAFVLLPAPLDFDSVPPPSVIQQYRLTMRTLAAQYGAPLVDGPALFKQKGAGVAWFFDHVHPTQEGHRLLGEGLAAALTAVGPPPEGSSKYP